MEFSLTQDKTLLEAIRTTADMQAIFLTAEPSSVHLAWLNVIEARCFHHNLLSCAAVLQMVVKTYMDMDQDSEEEKQQYLALALHLASEFFLRNPNKDVRLLVACCLADIFRIYAPEAPYTSHDKLKVSHWPWITAWDWTEAAKHKLWGYSIQREPEHLNFNSW